MCVHVSKSNIEVYQQLVDPHSSLHQCLKGYILDKPTCVLARVYNKYIEESALLSYTPVEGHIMKL